MRWIRSRRQDSLFWASYDGTYANFTVTGFNASAVAATPEPASLTLLAFGTIPILTRTRKRRASPITH